jgi:hypothetical protein
MHRLTIITEQLLVPSQAFLELECLSRLLLARNGKQSFRSDPFYHGYVHKIEKQLPTLDAQKWQVA